MKLGSKGFALALWLAASVMVVGGSASAHRAGARASATVVAPANVNETLISRGTGVFVNSVTGNLAIRVAVTSMAGTEDNAIRSVISSLQASINNDCADLAADPRMCGLAEHEGLLDGDPVSRIILQVIDDSSSSTADVSMTVAYD